MEGKTQSAFVFEDVRPLYFPLSIINDQTYKQPGKSEQSRSQNIYENDNSLTLALYRYANVDMIEIKNLYGGDQVIGEILQNPFNVFNVQNEKALKRNGNALEVSAAVSKLMHHSIPLELSMAVYMMKHSL